MMWTGLLHVLVVVVYLSEVSLRSEDWNLTEGVEKHQDQKGTNGTTGRTNNPESIVILLDYFHTCYKIISISTYGKVQHLLFMALSDAFGGYLRAHVLPYTRKSYYAGIVKYSEAQKLFLLYDDIKSFLKTDGRGWPLPTKAPLRSFKVKPLVINNGTEEACNLLFIIEREGKKRNSDRQRKRSSKGKELKLSKQTRRIQRQINDYNSTLLRGQTYLKNSSPQGEETNENEGNSGYRYCKVYRKLPPLDFRGGFSLGGAHRGEDYKEELRKKEEPRKHEELREEIFMEDPSGAELCKADGRKEEDQKEVFSIEDLFKDDIPNEEAQKEEEENEDLSRIDAHKEVQKEEFSKENHGRKETVKQKPLKEEPSKQHHLKEANGKGRAQTEKEIKIQRPLKDTSKASASEKSKEHSTADTTKKEFILKEVPCKEYILQEGSGKETPSTENPTNGVVSQKDAHKEHSSTKPDQGPNLRKDTVQHSPSESPAKDTNGEDLCKELSTTKPSKEPNLQKHPHKEHPSTEVPHKEHTQTLREDYKEHSTTAKPTKEHQLLKDGHKEHSTAGISLKEHSVTEVPPKEHSITEIPRKERSSTEIPPEEQGSTETQPTEMVFHEETTTSVPCRTETPSTEGEESTFEKVYSKGETAKDVFKEDSQTEAAPNSWEYQTEAFPDSWGFSEYQTETYPTSGGCSYEYQTEAFPNSWVYSECQTETPPEDGCQTGEEVICKETLEELPNPTEPSKKTHKKKFHRCRGRKRKHRKHKSQKKKQQQQQQQPKQGVPKAKGGEPGSKKTVTVPLPVLDDYDCPTSIALPFRKRPLRNLKAASSAFILENYYVTVMKCFIAKGNRRRDIKDFNGQFQRWLTSKVVPLLRHEQWYPGFGGVLRVLETIRVFGADKTNKEDEYEDYGFLFDEGAEFSVDSSFENKGTRKPQSMLDVVKGSDPLRRYLYVLIVIFSVVALFLLCGCLYCCLSPGRAAMSAEEEQSLNYQENPSADQTYADHADARSQNVYQDGKKDPYTYQALSTYGNPQTNQCEVWSYGDARGMRHQQQQEAHFLTKHTAFPKEPRLLHNVHTLWKKPSNLMNRYWTSDETKCYKPGMRTCNCTESCHCTLVTDSSAATKAKTRKSSTVTFFEGDDDVAHPRRNTSTRSSTQYSTTESGSEDFSSSEYSESSKSLRKHRNSTHYP